MTAARIGPPLAQAAGLALALAAGIRATPAVAGRDDDPLAVRVERAALAMQRQSWEQGILAQAALEAGADEQLAALARGMLIHVAKDGRVATLGGSPLDCLMCGEPLARAAEITGDPTLRAAADGLLAYVLERAPRAADGTLFHYDACMMSDSCHTAAPFLAALGRHDDARRQLEGYRRRLWDADARLYRAIWDESKQGFARRDFWGVGNGWVAVALTRMIRALPANRAADRGPLVAHLRELLTGCLAHERDDGLFHDVLDEPASFVETNLSQMLAYSIYEGVRGGWLDAELLPAADRMRSAARGKVDTHGLVQGVAGAPDFRHAGIAPEGQAFFLLMETAARKAGRPEP
jgi:rhamnogalacturonyl hydrolase YesR